jgi:hypothetical protein
MSKIEWKVTGQDFIDAITARLTDKNIRCYDTAIVQQLRELTGGEVMQIASFGDVTKWHNERINKDSQ